jgi:L-histidine N-alpha-methyltransferase
MHRMREPRSIQLHPAGEARLTEEAAAGLRATPAAVSPKFFYDALGSRLFEAITELPEYYPTRTEAAIFAAHAGAMAAALESIVGRGYTMIEPGAGSCAKAARLIPVLQPGRYVALDISADYVAQALRGLQLAFPQLDLAGVGLDFSTELALPAGLVDAPALLFYPGSSIGNFTPQQALHWLRQARELVRGGALLIGADLVKDHAVLQADMPDNARCTCGSSP